MYNAFPYTMPSTTSFLSKINFSSILTGVQKTLSVANQAIPLYYQVKPIIGNLKTIKKIGKELTKQPTTTSNVSQKRNENYINDAKINTHSIPEPTFFI